MSKIYAYDKPSVLLPRKGSIGNLFYVDSHFGQLTLAIIQKFLNYLYYLSICIMC